MGVDYAYGQLHKYTEGSPVEIQTPKIVEPDRLGLDHPNAWCYLPEVFFRIRPSHCPRTTESKYTETVPKLHSWKRIFYENAIPNPSFSINVTQYTSGQSILFLSWATCFDQKLVIFRSLRS